MDRVDHITRLGVPAEAGARSKCERLRTLDRRGIAPEQDKSSPRIAGAELPDIGQLSQGAGVQDRHVWAMSAQHNSDPPVLDVGGDDRETRIALDQLVQSSGKQIVEVGDNYGDWGMRQHERPGVGSACVFIGSRERKGERHLTPCSPATPPKITPSGGRARWLAGLSM